ncbi:glycosyltransferase family 4 protein [Calothrix sp. NIES-3974]|uniref:glycosyltransferase family 4 protein n=1 Tax=Calothrix sp. NIES-3974 TaxID=2005462 RepID=UPI000B5E30E7|nr:glycosyltransferase family 4 protein [Calothrix sp. NIES-3974]BAZ03436.1 glycosyl transferase, group 1 family protein [Calothrix sp. NIES-3974]
MKIAYLVNQYPKVSHSFIRREIEAIETHNVEVFRFSIRSCATELVDPLDQEELSKTKVILERGVWGLFTAFIFVFLTRPLAFFPALQLAVKLGWRSDVGILKHLIYFAEACVLFRWLKPIQVSHLHVHFGTNSTTVALLCHRLGGPKYSFTAHGPEEFDRARSISLSEKIHDARFVVAISEFGRSQLYRYCDYTQWEKTHVIRCGLNSELFQTSATPVPDNYHLVCVGRLCEQKGQLLLINAVQKLREQGIIVYLTLVGDGEMRQPIEALIMTLNLQQQVKITGWANQTQVQEYIRDSRVFVLPSFAEGLPVVIMEAFLMERPVISTYVAGIPELVKNQFNGWLVPPGSVTALVDAIKKAINTSPEELQKMGNMGKQAVLENHDIRHTAKQLIELFKRGENR